jgi:Family of unknown function (DUF5681)
MSKRVGQGSRMVEPSDQQTKNRRADGKFAKGNKAGKTFGPGRSGNPAGRPKSAILSDALRRELVETCPDDEQGRPWAEVIADQLIAKAATGDVAAAKEIADRTEGKARQHVTLSYTEREKYEIAVAKIMEESGCSREEAIRTLGLFRPDVLSLLNVN